MTTGRRLAVLAAAASLVFLAVVARAMPPSPPEPPIFGAIHRGDPKRVLRLLKDGADAHARDVTGRTTLARAAADDKAELVSYFLGRNPDLDARDLYGNTALHYAALRGNVATTKALLKAGASPRVWNRRCESPLDVAAGFGFAPTFKALVAKAKSLPPPTDGTEEECGLDAAKIKAPSYAAAFQSFHARQLAITSEDDYSYASEALQRLEKDPRAVVQAELLVPALVGLIGHKSPENAVEDPANDLVIRRSAAKTLAKITKSKPAKAAAAKALMKLVESGGCSAFKPRQCSEKKLDACEATPASFALPRDAEAEACFNCRYCEDTTIGHAFVAALDWFKGEKEHRAAAAKALETLKGKKLMPAAEFRRLTKKLGVKAK